VDGTVPGKLTISAVPDDGNLGDVFGANAKLTSPINVILPPIQTDNGIIYRIEGVLQ
jgi:hypothetical protein